MSELLQMAGNVEIQAAADGAKVPRVSILAYSGGEFSPAGWPNCCIDLAGADLAGEIPLLESHETAALDAIVGQGRASVRDGALHVDGVLTDATGAGQRVLALGRAGIKLQASVGFEPDRREFIRSGETVHINGRAIKAGERGLTVIRSGRLREVSLLPIGADPGTRVSIAARCGTTKGRVMSTDNETIVETPDEMRAAWDKPGMTDSERVVARWNAAAIAEPTVRQQTERFLHAALAGSLSFADFDREVLRAELRCSKLEAIRAERPSAPEIRASHADEQGAVMAAGLMLRAGYSKAAERQFGEHVLHAADTMRRGSLLDLCEASLRLEGIEKPHGREAMVKAAFSTNAMTETLGVAAEKILLDAYAEAPAAWREWCKVVSVSSFHEAKLLRPSFLGGFERLAPSGEIAHGHVGEETASIQPDTYAKMLKIDRRDIINDDAGAFAEAAAAMGRAAMRKLNDLVIQTLLGGVASGFFEAEERVNLIDDPLSVSAVASAIATLRARVDADGGSLDLVPKVLLVGPALESAARAICESELIEVAEGNPTGNSLKGLLVPVVEPRLANATLGGSATAWAVLAGPGDAPQAVAFLNGQQTPIVESMGMDADLDHLGLAWRAYFDFGSALVDWRASVLSTGDGE